MDSLVTFLGLELDKHDSDNNMLLKRWVGLLIRHPLNKAQWLGGRHGFWILPQDHRQLCADQLEGALGRLQVNIEVQEQIQDTGPN